MACCRHVGRRARCSRDYATDGRRGGLYVVARISPVVLTYSATDARTLFVDVPLNHVLTQADQAPRLWAFGWLPSHLPAAIGELRECTNSVASSPLPSRRLYGKNRSRAARSDGGKEVKMVPDDEEIRKAAFLWLFPMGCPGRRNTGIAHRFLRVSTGVIIE